MNPRIAASSQYVAAAARYKDLIYFIIRDRGLIAQDVEHARFIAFYKGQLAHMGDRNWRGVGACVVKKPNERLVAVGEDGEVFSYVGGVATDESMTPKPAVIRNVATIGGFAHACGMKRQVYKRVGDGAWTAMNAPAPAAGQNAGFEAITGFSTEEVYAAGWNGEIWEWDGIKWTDRGSPTNLILTGAACGEDGSVYICGQRGTLLKGRHNTWDLLDVQGFNEDFWDIHWFNGKLYLATMTALYTLDSGILMPVDFGSDVPGTCYRLTSAEGVLWSVGSDDVFSSDGTTWTRAD